MKNTKNTFDLSLDIPLYGDINKLNFCNEYELNHYCFYEGGDDGTGGPGGEEDSPEAGEASEDSSGSDAGDPAEFGGSTHGGSEFGAAPGTGGLGFDNTIAAALAFAKDQEEYVNDPSYPGVPPEAFVPTPGSLQPGFDPTGLTAVFSDPEFGEFGDFGFGVAPHGSKGDFGQTDVASLEAAKRGSTNPGLSLVGFQTGAGRGEFASLVGHPEPGSFNIGDALATAVNVFTGLPIGTMAQMGYNALTDNTGLGLASLGKGTIGAIGNMMGLNEVDPDDVENPETIGQEEGLTSLDVTEDFYVDDVYGSPDIRYNRNPYVRNPYVRKPYVRNPNIRYADGGGLVSLANGGSIRDIVEDQTTLIDVINTGQAMPPNIGATQAQGSMQPMQANQSNQQNVYTQSAQPQSFYAQPQQVKNYGNLY